MGNLGILFGELIKIGWVLELGEEENDFFVDVEIFDVVRKTVADGGVNDNVEISFFFDFAESGVGFGFAGFDVAFGEAPKTVVLINQKGVTIVDNDGATGFFVCHIIIIAHF